MNGFKIELLKFNRENNNLNIGIKVSGPYNPAVNKPKITIVFTNGNENRRLPISIQAYCPQNNMQAFILLAKYKYMLNYLFTGSFDYKEILLSFELTYGELVIDRLPIIISEEVKMQKGFSHNFFSVEKDSRILVLYRNKVKKKNKNSFFPNLLKLLLNMVWSCTIFSIAVILLPVFIIESILSKLHCLKQTVKNNKNGINFYIYHIQWRFNCFIRYNFGITGIKYYLFLRLYQFFCFMPICNNRVVFISNRRIDLTGNFAYVYEILKQDENLDIKFVLDDSNLRHMSFINIMRYGIYCATSKIILVDDYVELLQLISNRKNVVVIQLWHACGAFKTFGYSRLGLPGGQKQKSRAHRNYDYAIVSSVNISKYYAEGFGLSMDKIVATGIPRTDIFFDTMYHNKASEQFYLEYPELKGKKILLFAPTFRGNGKNSGYYPKDVFDAVKMYEALDGEYTVIVKHHPFVKNRQIIPPQYENCIIDLSDRSELNNLLFVTDLLITDYSSVIFEAALLDIPMLFFAFDLNRYTSTRGFYYEYEQLVPGNIVSHFDQMVTAVKNKDFEKEKINTFKIRFFDHLDGNSTKRVVDLISMVLNK